MKQLKYELSLGGDNDRSNRISEIIIAFVTKMDISDRPRGNGTDILEKLILNLWCFIFACINVKRTSVQCIIWCSDSIWLLSVMTKIVICKHSGVSKISGLSGISGIEVQKLVWCFFVGKPIFLKFYDIRPTLWLLTTSQYNFQLWPFNDFKILLKIGCIMSNCPMFWKVIQ